MKKMLLILTMFAAAVFSSLPAFAIEGDGTEETPFLITNQGELELVTDFPDCHFRLVNDIELEGIWIPICKQTASGSFSGVFDGAGYTISNLCTDGTEGGLFKNNSGTIKNLNVIIADEGLTGSGTIANHNGGTISDCVVQGDISGSFSYIGGICSSSNKNIERCKFMGSVVNASSSGSVGGICGENRATIKNSVALANLTGKGYAGGICGYNYVAEVSDCYFIGNINSSSAYKGGIAGSSYGNSYSRAIVRDCYAVPTLSNGGYGITGKESSYVTITTSYYDKTISGLTSTSYGTPKSTAAMKMKQTYVKDWDFDNTWGIDKNINNGYPYLLWEYPNAEEVTPYTVNSVKITDLTGAALEEIPDGSFYFDVSVTKNNNSKDTDCLIVAVYDENGEFIDLKYMCGTYYQNQEITFGTMIDKKDKKIGAIKGFVWDSVSGMIPLSNELSINN